MLEQLRGAGLLGIREGHDGACDSGVSESSPRATPARPPRLTAVGEIAALRPSVITSLSRRRAEEEHVGELVDERVGRGIEGVGCPPDSRASRARPVRRPSTPRARGPRSRGQTPDTSTTRMLASMRVSLSSRRALVRRDRCPRCRRWPSRCALPPARSRARASRSASAPCRTRGCPRRCATRRRCAVCAGHPGPSARTPAS